MKLREDFVLSQIVNTWVVLPLGSDTLDFTGMLTLNDTGAMLWRELEQGRSVTELVSALTDKYEVDEPQAQRDVEEFLEVLRGFGCIAD